MKYNIAFIEGWPASGKTALWACLDSTSQIFVEPLHVFAINSLLSLNLSSEDRRVLTVREVRKALSQTEYYKTEQYSYSGSFPISFGADMMEDALFDFNWVKFDNNFIRRVTANAINSVEYVEAYIDCYLDAYKAGIFKDRISTFVTMTNYFDFDQLDKLKSIIDFKLIQVKRPYQEIIWSRISRKSRAQDGANSHHFAPSFKRLLRSSEVQSLFNFDKFYELRSDEYLIISLNDLIKNTELEMKKVISYLELDWQDEFVRETRDGVLISSRYKLTSKSNDNPKFSYRIKVVLFVQFILAKYFRFKYNPFSAYAIFVYFGRKFKKKISE